MRETGEARAEITLKDGEEIKIRFNYDYDPKKGNDEAEWVFDKRVEGGGVKNQMAIL